MVVNLFFMNYVLSIPVSYSLINEYSKYFILYISGIDYVGFFNTILIAMYRAAIFALIVLAGQSSASACVKGFDLQVGITKYLSEALDLAKGIPDAADKTFSGWQAELIANVTSLNNTLNGCIMDFHEKYDGKIRRYYFCRRYYNAGVQAYNKGEKKLEEVAAKDLVAVVHNKFADKFNDNIKYIQDKADQCEGDACSDEEVMNDVHKRLLDTHDDWCKFANKQLHDENCKAEDGKKKAEKDIKRASSRLDRLRCVK